MERAWTQSQKLGYVQPYHPRSWPTLFLYLSFLTSKMGLLLLLQGLLWALSARHWLWRRMCVAVAEGRGTWPSLSLCFVCPLKDREGTRPFCPHTGVPVPSFRLRLHSFVGLCSRWVIWVAQRNAHDKGHGLTREAMRTGTLDLHVCVWQSAHMRVCKLIFRIRTLALEPPCPITTLRTLREPGLLGSLWLFQWELCLIFPVINLTLTQQI